MVYLSLDIVTLCPFPHPSNIEPLDAMGAAASSQIKYEQLQMFHKYCCQMTDKVAVGLMSTLEPLKSPKTCREKDLSSLTVKFVLNLNCIKT